VILDVLHLEPMQEIDQTPTVELEFLGEFVDSDLVLFFFRQEYSPLN